MTDSKRNSVHVLHVVPGLLPGGMELAMTRVICGLSNRGMRHSIACLKGEPLIAGRFPEGAAVYCFDARPNELRLPFRLARLIRDVRPEVVHARNWGAWPDTALGCLLARRRTPLILSFHGLGRANYMPLRRRLASMVLSRMASRLFTVSNDSKALITSKWGWPADRVTVIPNGVDTEDFHPSNESHERESRLIVGTVGNLRPIKNHALLIRACAALVQQGRDLEVRIAGEGEERDRLCALADSLGLNGRLKLFGHTDRVARFLQQLDIFVLSSDSEQHPNALNEAMACGLPAVATRVGSVPELLDEGRCGIIVPPGDVEQLTRALTKVAEDRVLRRVLGTAARQRACATYSLTKMLDEYEQLYRRFCSDTRVARDSM
jgi:glycosyltransferase involved in cell wall biosynthesis